MNFPSSNAPRSAGQSPAGDELAWLAFRYLANELSSEEVEQFEARLAVDQEAREALAHSVHLVRAVAAAEASPVAAGSGLAVASRERSSPQLAPLAWVSAGVSAALLLVALGWNAGWFASPDRPAVATRQTVSPELATVWTEVRSSPVIDMDDLTTEELALLNEIESDLDTEAPSWMTAAVLGIAGHEPAAPEMNSLEAVDSRPQEN
jgi:hypothetical protein